MEDHLLYGRLAAPPETHQQDLGEPPAVCGHTLPRGGGPSDLVCHGAAAAVVELVLVGLVGLGKQGGGLRAGGAPVVVSVRQRRGSLDVIGDNKTRLH